MTLWNVSVPVVDLIVADTDTEAIAKLAAKLTEAGFDVYEGGLHDAFASEEAVAL